ncbi:glycosyltransferase, group 1 family protein [Candidatus Nitrosarchaeum limnium BG20]|uniref:Glycosyltransferase, group 1 family protein n=2 Tax=Nitrosarchaeum TaxID=1007082 RepID=S2E1V0_9ARCH|nr:glycosyltransferase, group 1 family protein [Candidatus Nitrosarchaeum limnium BG20]
MKIPLVSAFLEDDVYETRLNDKFMEEVICNEDHFYHRIAKALSSKQFEPIVYYMSQEKIEKKFIHKYGHTIIRIPAKKINFLHEPIIYSPQLIKNIKKNYEICNFVSGYYVMYKVPDMFDYSVFKLYKKMPIVARWAGGNNKWLIPIRKSIKKAALQKCDKILVSSIEEINVLQEVFCIKRENISQIVNPIDLTLFKKRERNKVAEKISLDVNFRYLLYVGRLTKNKGLELLLEIFNELNFKFENIKLIIIGDGPLLEFIKNFIKNHDLEKKIILTGRLNHEKACYYYNIATVLVNTGLSAGLPNVIIESLASGTPTITTNVGASKEYIDEEKNNGIVIKPSNKDELKNAIITILENEKKFKNWDTDFLEKFSYQEFGNKLTTIYSELL